VFDVFAHGFLKTREKVLKISAFGLLNGPEWTCLDLPRRCRV
jgi:hypothetical protein